MCLSFDTSPFSYAEKVENQRKIIQIIGDNVINENLSVDSQLTQENCPSRFNCLSLGNLKTIQSILS